MAIRYIDGEPICETPEDALALAAGDPFMSRWIGIGREELHPGRYSVVIPGWRPALVNELMGSRWRSHKLKLRDRRVVRDHFSASGVPAATGRRKVRIKIIGRYCGGRFPDPDSPWKSLLDALVACGMLVDDSADLCEITQPTFESGERFETTITLEESQS